MKSDMYFHRTTMPESRKADYYLSCFEGSVFIDFNISPEHEISLIRISFDEFGCCDIEGKSNNLNIKDSHKFMEEIEQEELDQIAIAELVMKAIGLNKDFIWPEALDKYGLIEYK